MTLEMWVQLIGVAVAVVTLLITLHDKHPHLFQNLLESIFNGIPFVFIANYLPIAIALFTANRIYFLYKESKRPNISTVDVYWTLANLYLLTGIFATIVAWIKR